jgi:hypothetical protein
MTVRRAASQLSLIELTTRDVESGPSDDALLFGAQSVTRASEKSG